jgi:stage V sporulation protein AB
MEVLWHALETGLIVVVGFSGGLITGTGFIAVLSALSLPARLSALTYSRRANRIYELALAAGVWVAALWLPFPFALRLGPVILAAIGLPMGIFVGMLASALAETVGVMPVIAARTGAGPLIDKVVWAVAVGKIIGSLIFLTFPPFTAP